MNYVQKLPLVGLNWRELGLAYVSFLVDSEVGIRHILAAGRYSNWESWVKQRLLKRSAHLKGQPITVNLKELAQLPDSTLGGRYARHMIALGLDPDAFMGAFDDEDWFDQRTAIAHDLYHVVTGFDASPVGEFGVAAFTLLQYWDLLNVFVLTFVPISLLNPLWTISLLSGLWRGLRLGMTCKPIIGYAFELNWEKPLSQVRDELGIGSLFPVAS